MSAHEQPVYEWNGRRYVYDPTRRQEIRDIPTIIKVKPLKGFSVWVEYENGEQGEADLNHLLIQGMFYGWRNRQYFESVRPVGDFLVWGEGEVDIAPESLYMWVTGASLDEISPIRFVDVPQH